MSRPDVIGTAIRAILDAAIAKASGDGAHRFSERQLFYPVRDLANLPSLKWCTFVDTINKYEANLGHDLPRMYRDDRGVIYSPHSHEEIPLGTRSVEAYQPEAWLFNKVLYIEKQGFFELLKDSQWPERHDCLLLTAKGQPTRAARDLLDLLGQTGEPLLFYCVHDCDGPGTIIKQSLQEETIARAARKVDVVDLGLTPKDGLAMGLAVEEFEPAKKKDGTPHAVPVADDYEAERRWFQSHRIELNAMTSPQFLDWLDRKMAEHGNGKLVPPTGYLTSRLTEEVGGWLSSLVDSQVREDMADTVAEIEALEGQIDARIDEELEAARGRAEDRIEKMAEELPGMVAERLERTPTARWTAPLGSIARELAGEVLDDDEGGGA